MKNMGLIASKSSLFLMLLAMWCIFSDAGSTWRTNMGRQLQTEDSTGCATTLATSANGDLAAAYGILFTVESAVTDNVGPVIASLGFHVETNLMTGSSFNFEVYVLNADGYYADPERPDSPLDELSYGYRGELGDWTMVSSGQVAKTELVVDERAVSGVLRLAL
jgi:hypothetical protein